MILIDTSIWVDHLRTPNATVARLLEDREVLVHPFVIGELALGNLQHRSPVLDTLSLLPQAVVASHDETLEFVDQHRLFRFGIGYVDAHLLASTRLTSGATLWTRDKRLRRATDRLALTAKFPS
jgi:predicted nucleic acid-binding protein